MATPRSARTIGQDSGTLIKQPLLKRWNGKKGDMLVRFQTKGGMRVIRRDVKDYNSAICKSFQLQNVGCSGNERSMCGERAFRRILGRQG